MIADLTFRIEVESSQKLTALRSRLAEHLVDDQDVTLINESQAQASQSYLVAGVDTASKEAFKETIEAMDEDAAMQEACDLSSTRVVVTVTPTP